MYTRVRGDAVKRLLFWAFILGGLLAGLLPQRVQAQGGGYYTVQQGDTLYSIGAAYGVNAYDLAAMNGLTGNEWIYAGQQLQLPGGPSFNPAPSFQSGFTYQDNFAAPSNFYLAVPPNYAIQRAPTWGNPGQPVWFNGDNSPYSAQGYGWQPPANAYTPPRFYQPMAPAIQAAPMAPQPYPPLHIPPVFPGQMRPQGEKWIDVNLTSQTLIAYEHQTPVFRTRVSSGLPQYPTVAGTFQIYLKYEKADMSGGAGDDAYYLPDVPYIMYFHGNYGLHGTYWHNNFGTPMSHGCVNLATPDAQWLFNWATLGTRVVTHY
jgi:L,D-transpeptidase catalytic domain/LysM domain